MRKSKYFMIIYLGLSLDRRVEAIVESFIKSREDLDQEKRAMEKKRINLGKKRKTNISSHETGCRDVG